VHNVSRVSRDVTRVTHAEATVSHDVIKVARAEAKVVHDASRASRDVTKVARDEAIVESVNNFVKSGIRNDNITVVKNGRSSDTNH